MSLLPDSLQTLLPHFSLALSLVWGGYLLVLAAWIVLEKREPIATLSWLLVLAWLPVVGLLIYHLFGPRRIRRQRLKRLRARSGLPADWQEAPAERSDKAGLTRLIASCSGHDASSARAVELLVDGRETFAALLAAIADAQQHIHLEYYIFEPDQTGTRLRDALIARAQAGVRVRLLLDAVGSSRLGSAFLAPLKAAGIELAWFHPLHLKRLLRRRINLRNHRKLAVIDGRVGFAGGVNIHDAANDALDARAQRDLHLCLHGRVVRGLQQVFVEDWHYASGVALADASLWPASEAGPIAAQLLVSGPDSPWELSLRVQVEAIHQASWRVWLTTPYFVPGEAARMALTSAALRGVDVRILVPHRSDSRVVSAAARSYYSELLAAGVRVFEYGPRMLHSKALLVDADHCILGSANFDMRSFRLNFELGLLLHDAALAQRLEQVMTTDQANSREVLPGQAQAPLWQRLLDACARLLSPVL